MEEALYPRHVYHQWEVYTRIIHTLNHLRVLASTPINYITFSLCGDIQLKMSTSKLVSLEDWYVHVLKSDKNKARDYTSYLFPLAKLGYINAIKVFLDDERVDLSDEREIVGMIIRTIEYKHHTLLEILLNDKRISFTRIIGAAMTTAVEIDDDKALQLLCDQHIVMSDFDLEDIFEKAMNIGNPKIVRVLLSTTNIIPINRDLYIAIKHGDLELVTLLLADSRINPGIEMNHAMYLATTCANRDIKIARAILADKHVNPSDGDNFIINSSCGTQAFKCDIEILKLLLADTRVNPGAQNSRAVISALMWYDEERIKLLLSDGRVDPSVGNNCVFISAVAHRDINTVKLLLADKRVNPADQNNRAIRTVAQNYNTNINTKIAKLLLSDKRIDPGANDNEAIRSAALNGNANVAQLLLADARVDPGAKNNKAIWSAAFYGRVDVVRLLLADARVDPGANANKAIRAASSRHSHPSVAEMLLRDERVDPNVKNNKALQLAVRHGKTKIVALLLKNARHVWALEGYYEMLSRAYKKKRVAIADLLKAYKRKYTSRRFYTARK